MPWVLAEYLHIQPNVPEHDHEFSVRWFDSAYDVTVWASQWDTSLNTVVKVMPLPGGGASTRPQDRWVGMTARNLLYFHDSITPGRTAPGFAWVGDTLAHNFTRAIDVNRWRIYEDGSMNHDCNPNRTWRSRPFSGMVSRHPSRVARYCLNCGASVTDRWLRVRATSIATRGGVN
jgi:hypothetical protein